MHGGVLLEGWCQLLLDGLVAGGVREVVMSPGSRSTPLVLAALRHPRLAVEVIVDERAAAFFALGRARVTGRPPLLVRTSGSAGGHDLPAVIEAGEAGWPLIIATADRPPELQGVRAPQTVDQARLFGFHAVGYFDPGPPDPSPGALRAVRGLGARAAAAARGPRPGAVQINLPARKPLEPPAERSEADRAFSAEVDRLRSSPSPRLLPAAARPSADGLRFVLEALRGARRPLIVAGPGPRLGPEDRAALLELLAFLGAPHLLEATSQLRFGPGGRGAAGLDAALALPELRAALAPDLVLQLGDPPVGSAAQASLRAWGGAKIVLAPRGFPDPDARAIVAQGELAEWARALLEAGVAPEVDASFASRWAEVESAAAKSALLEGEGEDELGEAAVTRLARRAVPEGGLLVIGNSLPVRHVDSFVEPGGPPVDVLHQRGASGIDGLIAGAIGASRSAPTVLLLGDVSARHDLGALALAEKAGPELTVVVLHNGGGRIFEGLPIAAGGRAEAAELAAFTTPDERSLVPVAKALGWSQATVVRRPSELERALATPSGPRFVEARVAPGDAARSLARLRARIAESLGLEGEKPS